jgi:hypothetical protein
MFVFGHLGIGSGLVSLVKRELPISGVLVGTLLPDLIDKPIFYGLVRRRIVPLELQSMLPGTRTLGHTLVAVLVVATLALLSADTRRSWLVAIALGMVSHLLLDVLADCLAALRDPLPFSFRRSAAVRAAVFPLLGPFARTHTSDFAQHFWAALRLHGISEIAGLAVLVTRVRLRARSAHQRDSAQAPEAEQ